MRQYDININSSLLALIKAMRINHRNNSDLILDGRVIERVEEFCYMGSSMVSQDGGALRDMISRINKAKGSFTRLRPVWRSPRIRRKTKLAGMSITYTVKIGYK